MCVANAYRPNQMLNHVARIQSEEQVQSSFINAGISLMASPSVVLNLVTVF